MTITKGAHASIVEILSFILFFLIVMSFEEEI